jgi:hypothetical protein
MYDRSKNDPSDIAGTRFGRLVAERWLGRKVRGASKYHVWEFKCDCGAKFHAVASKVKNGHTSSCGCGVNSFSKNTSARKTLSEAVEHRAWNSIKSRCLNPNSRNYHNYGGRGVRVCAGWAQSSTNFVRDVGARPTTDHSIDRIDNDGHYSCGRCAECNENGWSMNVRWSTTAEQARNRRQNVFLEFDGRRQCLADWANEVGMKFTTLEERLRAYGWSVEKALTTPVLIRTGGQ